MKKHTFEQVPMFVVLLVVAGTLACSPIPPFLGGEQPTMTPVEQSKPGSGAATLPPTIPVVSSTRPSATATPQKQTRVISLVGEVVEVDGWQFTVDYLALNERSEGHVTAQVGLTVKNNKPMPNSEHLRYGNQQ